MTPESPPLRMVISDDIVEIFEADRTRFEMPVGPMALLAGPLSDTDPPSAADLVNALGLVQDYFDDIISAAPAVAAASSVVASGPHAVALARVETGQMGIPDDYELHRTAADEVFRTLASETVTQRRFNPALESRYVEPIIGTCCVILGVMRRLDIASIAIDPTLRAVT